MGNNRKKTQKIVITTITGLMLASSLFAIIPAISALQSSQQATVSDATIALDRSTKISTDSLALIRTQQQVDNDWTLTQTIETVGANPAYILENETYIVDPVDIEKKIQHYQKGRYTSSDSISFVWQTTDAHVIVGELATENPVVPRIVSVSSTDSTLALTNNLTHESVKTATANPVNVESFKLPYSEFKEQFGEAYAYEISLPTMTTAITNARYTDSEYSKRVLRAEDSSLYLISTADDKIVALNYFISDYSKIQRKPKAEIEALEGKSLSEFLELAPMATLVLIEENLSDSSIANSSYMILDESDVDYTFSFIGDEFESLVAGDAE